MFQFQCQFYSSSQDADVQFCKVICDIYPGIGYWVECGGSGIADDDSQYWGWLSRRQWQDTGISSTASSSVLYIHASSNWIFVYQHLSLHKDETRKSFRTLRYFERLQLTFLHGVDASHISRHGQLVGVGLQLLLLASPARSGRVTEVSTGFTWV